MGKLTPENVVLLFKYDHMNDICFCLNILQNKNQGHKMANAFKTKLFKVYSFRAVQYSI